MRALVAFALALGATIPPSLDASADEGRCAPRLGRPPCTILRPVPAPGHRWVPFDAPECVVLVGGFGSLHLETPGFFERALADLDAGDGRPFRRVVFGLERADLYPYDTYGALDAGARSLRGLLRDLEDECYAVHLVAHSMGGLVSDRALALGGDGGGALRTYLPLSGPHNGAFAARALALGIALDGEYADGIADLSRISGQHDPTSPAARDLALARAPLRALRVETLRQRMVTDLMVLRRDSADRRYDVREYLPRTPGDGHEVIVDDPFARAAVAAALRAHAVPPDPRSMVERAAASFTSLTVDDLWSGLVGAAGLTAAVAAVGVGVTSALAGAGADLIEGEPAGAADRFTGRMRSLGTNIVAHVPEAAELGIPVIRLAPPFRLTLLMNAATALVE